MFEFGMGMDLLVPEVISLISKLGAMMVLIRPDSCHCAIHWKKEWHFGSPPTILQ